MADDEQEQKKPKDIRITIGDIESIKRAFSDRKYDEFKQLLAEKPYQLWTAKYVYASDYEGSPDFVLTNKNLGFVQSDVLAENRRHLYIAFVCRKEGRVPVFSSYWIVNINESLESFLGDEYKDFTFIKADLETIISGFCRTLQDTTTEKPLSFEKFQ